MVLIFSIGNNKTNCYYFKTGDESTLRKVLLSTEIFDYNFVILISILGKNIDWKQFLG